jgi:hypothetical protein
LCAKKLFDAARQFDDDLLSVGNDLSGSHHVNVRKLTSGGQLMRKP